MAISTTLATPENLVEDQELSILEGKTEIVCYNDPQFKQRHYRTIPNDTSNEGSIKWGNVKSVKRSDGDYAISVSMFEYIPDAGPSSIFLNLLQRAGADGILVNVPERGEMYVMPNSVSKENNGHVVFRKRVWVRNSDLILGSLAQQQAMTEAERLKKQQEIDDLSKPTDPITGNSSLTANSSTTLIIVGVVLFLFFAIIAILKGLKNKKDKEALSDKQSPNAVNIIRIPKSKK